MICTHQRLSTAFSMAPLHQSTGTLFTYVEPQRLTSCALQQKQIFVNFQHFKTKFSITKKELFTDVLR